MNNADFEKIADCLATIATTAGTEKTAANGAMDFLNSDAGRYLIGGLGGAGAGAILGASQPDKEKRKRNMLYYGALGGLGGVGLAHALNGVGGAAGPNTNKQEDTKPNFVADVARAAIDPKAPPIEQTGTVLDAPVAAARAAQKLPGMAGLSPAAQAGGGAAGLYAAVRHVNPKINFSPMMQRINNTQLSQVNEGIAKNRALLDALNAKNIAAASAKGREAVNVLKLLGGDPADLRAAMHKHVGPAQAAASAERANAAARNAKAIERVTAGNTARTRFGKVLNPVARILSTLGLTYGGATAPNWAPYVYEGANELYSGQGK